MEPSFEQARSARPQLPIGYSRTPFLEFLSDRRILDIAGMQGHCQEAGPSLGARVPGHAMHAPRRFVKRFPGLVSLDRFVVDSVLVVAFKDVAEHRAGVAVRRIFLAG